jgi:hypothetical protein
LRNRDDVRDAKAQPVTLADLRFRQEKPWDERIKGVLDSLAKAQALRPVTPPPAPVVVKAPEPPALVRIRTLRGANEGVIHIQSNAPASSGRLAGRPIQ